jgi:hypothetical protein
MLANHSEFFLNNLTSHQFNQVKPPCQKPIAPSQTEGKKPTLVADEIPAVGLILTVRVRRCRRFACACCNKNSAHEALPAVSRIAGKRLGFLRRSQARVAADVPARPWQRRRLRDTSGGRRLRQIFLSRVRRRWCRARSKHSYSGRLH